jgi:cobalt-zinc-cadmium resistance protein CzcA
LITRIVHFSVEHRGWTLLAVLTVVVIAGWLALRLRFDALPDLTNVQVQVLTTSPGLGTEEVEKLVTVPVERALSGAPGLVVLRSTSRPGVSAVTAVFSDDTDLWRARQIVTERVAEARERIPPEAGRPEVAPPTTGLGEIYQFTLTSDRYDRAALTRILQRDLAPRLRAVPGVVEVNAWGAAEPQLEVRADPYALAAHGISVHALEAAVAEALGQRSGGYLTRGDEQEAVRARANPTTPHELAEIVIRPGEPPLRLGQIAEIREAGSMTVGLGTAGGQGEGLFVMVQLLAGEDARTVTADVRARVAEIAGTLPDGVTLEPVYDREVLIANTLGTATTSLVEGGIIVIVVLVLLMGDVRASLVVASVIPMSMIGALAGLSLLGFSGNLMSLGAVDFGLVVDGAVVVIEGMVALGVVAAADRKRAYAARAASLARPVLFASGVLMLVYVPILTLGGTEGRLFRPMALTVVLAVATAIVLALTYVPALGSLVLRPEGWRLPALLHLLDRPYAAFAKWTVRHPVLLTGAAFATFAVSVGVVASMGQAFVPRLEEGDLVLQTERLPTVSPDAAVRLNTQVERALLRFPEVLGVATRTGSPALATDPMGLGESDVLIRLTPKDTWTTAEDLDGLVEALEHAVHDADPSATLNFTQPIEMRFNELLEGIPSDVGLSIYGPDLDALLATGRSMAEVLEKVPGAADVRAPSVEGLTAIEVTVDPVRAGRLGVASHEALAMVQAVQVGREIGGVIRGEFRDPVVLRLALPPGVPVEDLPLLTQSGVPVPLAEVADVARAPMPAAVRRDGGSRRVTVYANVRGRDVGSFVREATRAVADVPLPPSSWIAWSGEYEQLQAAAWRTAAVVPLVLVAILALLRIALGGLRPALIIAANVPIAVSGGVFALALRGLPLSMSAIVGFIALFGVAVMNGIVLVARIGELREELPADEAAWRGAIERFHPVLLTATIAGLGFVPMAISHGLGAEVQTPLATVIIGGLVTSTVLTLGVVPAVCARWWRK